MPLQVNILTSASYIQNGLKEEVSCCELAIGAHSRFVGILWPCLHGRSNRMTIHGISYGTRFVKSSVCWGCNRV
jgi:hypothetical protein